MAYTRETFTIYDKQFQTGLWERMDQNVNGFNAASANALLLDSDTVKGDYEKNTFFDAIDEDAIERRDPNSTSDVTSKDITQSEVASVNLFRRIGPVDKTLGVWYEIGKTPQHLSLLVGQMVGDLKAKKMLNTAVLVAKTAIEGQVALVEDLTAGSAKALTVASMAKAIGRFGDAYERIACWVMHSVPFFDLMGGQIADKMETVAGSIVFGGSPATLGKPVIVTDSPALVDVNLSAADDHWVLGLVPGACTIKDSNQSIVESAVITGKDNLIGRIQGEYSLNVSVKGFSWNTGTGGANPTDATLGTTANWNKIMTSNKDLAGVAIKCQAA